MSLHYRMRLAAVIVCFLISANTNQSDAAEFPLPDWSGWWEFNGELPSAMLALNPPPLRPDDLAKLRAARVNPNADSDPLRFCRPPRFVGASGSISTNVEFLFTSGRVTLANEGGLVRRIYTDGRLLADPEPSNAGTSVGRWEGQTLVVETIGINPAAKFPETLPGAVAIGNNVKVTERIALRDANTIEFDVTVEAPDILTKPYRRTIPFARSKQTVSREITACAEFDRAIDPVTGLQRFDATPPVDLPPPPSN